MTAGLSGLLALAGFPAALLLGAMIAGILLTAGGLTGQAGHIGIPRPVFDLAQAAVGAMIAGQIPLSALSRLQDNWPLFLLSVPSVIVLAFWLGYLLARRQVLPGNTAIWGASPGAAQAMIFLAEADGADIRLVAIMQYLRVVMVAAGASIIARFWGAPPPVDAVAAPWFPVPDRAFLDFGIVMALGLVTARVTRMAAGSFLIPLLLGAGLHWAGLLSPVAPAWATGLAFAVIGWMIGLRFSRDILRHALRAFWRLAASVMMLLLLCGALAAGLVVFAGIDPLTAYLATSPGGTDSIAIIAASAGVDMGFVMALQTARFVLVLVTGPTIARLVANHLSNRQQSRTAD